MLAACRSIGIPWHLALHLLHQLASFHLPAWETFFFSQRLGRTRSTVFGVKTKKWSTHPTRTNVHLFFERVLQTWFSQLVVWKTSISLILYINMYTLMTVMKTSGVLWQATTSNRWVVFPCWSSIHGNLSGSNRHATPLPQEIRPFYSANFKRSTVGRKNPRNL